MTEEQRQRAAESLKSMLNGLRGSASDRKLRLAACACFRKAEGVPDDVARQAIFLAERYADGLATNDERADWLCSVIVAAGGTPLHSWNGRREGYVCCGTVPPALLFVLDGEYIIEDGTGRPVFRYSGDIEDIHDRTFVILEHLATLAAVKKQPERGFTGRVRQFLSGLVARALDDVWMNSISIDKELFVQAISDQCNLLRDIFGNPLRPVTFLPEWRTDTAVSLARHMYESRDFSAMPILADALQDAGCDSDDILAHCRDPHPVHVRGCWAVDLVLGRV